MRQLVIGALLSAVVAVPALAGTPVTAEEVQGTPPSLAELESAGNRIKTRGVRQLPDAFLHVAVDAAAGKITLYAPAGRPGTRELLDEARGIPVEIRTVRFSRVQRQALVSQIAADGKTWEAAGIVINTIRPESTTDLVSIGVAELTAATEAALKARYGADRVTVTQAGPATPATRFDDTTTYKSGGIKLVAQSNGGGCTAGFGIHSQSLPAATSGYMLTAGHCFVDGERVNHNGVYQGTAVQYTALYREDGLDAMLVWMKSANRIWETDSLLARSDGSVVDVAEGVTVCHSGIATDKKCGTSTGTGGECVRQGVIPYLRMCGLQRVWKSTLLVAAGDSGGPVFIASPWTTSTTRYTTAVGITSMIPDGQPCTTDRGFQNPFCDNEMWYTELSELYNRTGWWPNY